MSNVIRFPGSGEKIAIYTHNHMYIGTTSESETIFNRTGIWLTDAAILPIKSQVAPADVLPLTNVLVMWDQVVALGACPEIDPPIFPEPY